MKEFEFRAWDKKNKVMMPVCSWEMSAVGYITTGSYNDIHGNEKTGGVIQEFIINQYIGITDKNSKKIFEGDIVKFYDEAGEWFCIGTVFYVEDETAFKHGFTEVHDNIPEKDDFRPPKRFWSAGEYTCEVIGNIYENPEITCEFMPEMIEVE